MKYWFNYGLYIVRYRTIFSVILYNYIHTNFSKNSRTIFFARKILRVVFIYFIRRFSFRTFIVTWAKLEIFIAVRLYYINNICLSFSQRTIKDCIIHTIIDIAINDCMTNCIIDLNNCNTLNNDCIMNRRIKTGKYLANFSC